MDGGSISNQDCPYTLSPGHPANTRESDVRITDEDRAQHVAVDPLVGRVRWEQLEGRLVVHVDKKREQVRYVHESEETVTIIIEPKTENAPNTNPLKPKGEIQYR